MSEIIISLNDFHVPFEDKRAVGVAFNFCREIQPDVIVIHEVHDFYAISKFSRDPRRLNSLQEELDEVEIYLAKLRKACPDAKIKFLNSNHLMRLKKYIWNHAAELSSLRALELPNLIPFDRYGIDFSDVYVHGDVLFKHGTRVHKFSAYTAKNEYTDEGMSGASGHTHRVGLFCRTERGGVYDWMECGCLCDLTPEYMEGKVADWQHGFGMGIFEPDGNYILHPFRMKDYRIIWKNDLKG